jgi:hypothetical protein
MPAQILATTGSAVQTIYPDGFGWANELVHQKYISAPNAYRDDGSFQFVGDSVFRCPEGLEPDQGSSLPSTSNEPDWPTNTQNNYFTVLKSHVPRADGQPLYAVATWYQLNSRTMTPAATSTNDPFRKGTQKVSPFLDFVTAATDADINDPRFRRKISMIRKSSVVVMIAEAADPDWVQDTPTAEPGASKPMTLRRIGARHGKKTADGLNAFINICFFDAHVELKATEPLSYADPSTLSEGSGTILYLNKQ